MRAAHAPAFQPPEERSFWARRRWRLHEILEVGSVTDPVSKAVDAFLIVLIVTNVVVFAASTVPVVGERWSSEIEVFNLASVAIFTAEYLLRLWVCIDLPLYRLQPRWRARLSFAATPMLVIDLLAILPFYLGPLLPFDLRVLRALRLLRFFKIARYSPALQILLDVVREEARALFGALIIMMSLALFAATVMFFLERDVQPEKFGSVPAAMWWAVSTLTTVGFGDVVPITAASKMFGGLMMGLGLAMYALPIGILSTSFAREIARRDFVVTWNLLARVPLFAKLDADSLSRIMGLLHSQRVPQGTIIIRPGEPATGMYFLVAGTVVVEREDEKSIELAAGDHFGEMALLEKRPRRVAVVAKSECHLLELDAEDFQFLRHRLPLIAEHMQRVADERR